MATIINTPAPAPANNDNNSSTGLILGILILVAFLAILFFYGLPALRSATQQSAPQINVPDQIDVNVNPNGGN